MSKEEVEIALNEFFVEREGEGVLDYLRGVDLVDAGILDSLDFVSLSIFLERRLGRKIDLNNPEVFSALRHYDTLMTLITTEQEPQ